MGAAHMRNNLPAIYILKLYTRFDCDVFAVHMYLVESELKKLLIIRREIVFETR